MELTFSVDDVPASFVRNDFTGRTELRVGADVHLLQSPLRLSTHFSTATRRVWTERVGEHTIEVEKRRPRLLGGLRANSFVVRVDGAEVATAVGK